MDKYTILPPPSIQPEILDDSWNDEEVSNDSFESSGNESSEDNLNSFEPLVDSNSQIKDFNNTIPSSW